MWTFDLVIVSPDLCWTPNPQYIYICIQICIYIYKYVYIYILYIYVYIVTYSRFDIFMVSFPFPLFHPFRSTPESEPKDHWPPAGPNATCPAASLHRLAALHGGFRLSLGAQSRVIIQVLIDRDYSTSKRDTEIIVMNGIRRVIKVNQGWFIVFPLRLQKILVIYPESGADVESFPRLWADPQFKPRRIWRKITEEAVVSLGKEARNTR